jgi:hypothetical protein
MNNIHIHTEVVVVWIFSNILVATIQAGAMNGKLSPIDKEGARMDTLIVEIHLGGDKNNLDLLLTLVRRHAWFC